MTYYERATDIAIYVTMTVLACAFLLGVFHS